MDPITGERWKCIECTDLDVDLCKECYEAQDFEIETHKKEHAMKKILDVERVPYYLDY